MFRFVQWSLGVLLMAVAAVSCVNKGDSLKEVSDEKYKPGQVWSYKTRAEEAASRLRILRVEETSDRNRIVHIRVENVRLKNCSGGPEPDSFEQMPFSKSSLDKSVIKVVGSEAVPGFSGGYSEWRKAWDAGKAGYYTITVSEALDVAQKTFNQSVECSH